MTDLLQNRTIPSSVQKALDATEFRSTPPDAPNYKFVISHQGDVFWVPPFEVAGGMMYGEVWEQFQDSPTHTHVATMLDLLEAEDEEYGFGYCTDGEVQVNTDMSVTKYADKILEWWPNHEYIEWDYKEVPLSSLEWFKSASKEKKQKQRKRRNRNKQRSNFPYWYGPWWAGVINPESVVDHGEGHEGGGTTMNQSGGDFGSSLASSKKEQ